MKKTTSQKFSNRLAQYGALSAAIAGITGLNAQEQISYSDIPDEVVSPGGNFALDLNSDSIGDLLFLVNGGGNGAMIFPVSSISASYYNYTAIVGEIVSGFNYPFNLNGGDIINSANNAFYYGRGDLFWANCYPNSNFCDGNDGFLGIRLNIPLMGGGFDTHNGWIRIHVGTSPTNHSITIKDFAYNMTPDAPIEAGQTTSLGIGDNVLSKIKVVASNKSISLYNLPNETHYNVLNMTGKEVLKGSTNESNYVIEASTLASGVYIVELGDTNTNAVIRKKVVLQ